jgi:hypothetical protein
MLGSGLGKKEAIFNHPKFFTHDPALLSWIQRQGQMDFLAESNSFLASYESLSYADQQTSLCLCQERYI